jgi:hypothetical protein
VEPAAILRLGSQLLEQGRRLFVTGAETEVLLQQSDRLAAITLA